MRFHGGPPCGQIRTKASALPPTGLESRDTRNLESRSVRSRTGAATLSKQSAPLLFRRCSGFLGPLRISGWHFGDGIACRKVCSILKSLNKRKQRIASSDGRKLGRAISGDSRGECLRYLRVPVFGYPANCPSPPLALELTRVSRSGWPRTVVRVRASMDDHPLRQPRGRASQALAERLSPRGIPVRPCGQTTRTCSFLRPRIWEILGPQWCALIAGPLWAKRTCSPGSLQKLRARGGLRRVQPFLHLHEAYKMIPFMESAFGAEPMGVHKIA